MHNFQSFKAWKNRQIYNMTYKRLISQIRFELWTAAARFVNGRTQKAWRSYLATAQQQKAAKARRMQLVQTGQRADGTPIRSWGYKL